LDYWSKKIGLTAGASAPEALVQGVIDRLNLFIAVEVEHLDGVQENVVFKLPSEVGVNLKQDQMGT